MLRFRPTNIFFSAISFVFLFDLQLATANDTNRDFLTKYSNYEICDKAVQADPDVADFWAEKQRRRLDCSKLLRITPDDPLSFFVHPETLAFCSDNTGKVCHRSVSEKYWGMTGRFISKEPVSTSNLWKIFQAEMENGDTAFYGVAKYSGTFPLDDDAADMDQLIGLRQHMLAVERRGKFLDSAKQIQVVDIEYHRLLKPTYEFKLSNGNSIFNDEIRNIIELVELIPTHLETEFLNHLDLFRVTKDEFEDRFVLSAKSFGVPIGINVLVGSQELSGRAEVTYYAKNWLFVEKVKFNADGEFFEFDGLKSDDFKRDSSSSIWEWAYVKLTESSISKLKRIVNSKRTQIRFYGKDYHADKELSDDAKKQVELSLRLLGYL